MTAYEPLPAFLRDLIASFPRAGDGVNLYLFKLARYLHALRTEDEIFALLRAASEGCGRPVDDKEIRRAIQNSKPVAWQPGAKGQRFELSPRRPAYPPRQYARIDELVRKGAGLYDLWETSPLRLEGPSPSELPADTEVPEDPWQVHTVSREPMGPYTETIIDTLFPANPLLCAALATGKGDFATRRREVWRGHLSRCALIVPNPMARVYG
jgi:hypothetical protein